MFILAFSSLHIKFQLKNKKNYI